MSSTYSSPSLSYLKQQPPMRMHTRRGRDLDRPSRTEVLAKPSQRRLEELWLEKGLHLPPLYSNNIKGALEANYFVTPEQTEDYFRQRSSQNFGRKKKRKLPPAERRQWLSDFSTQVASHLCEWVVEHRDQVLSEEQKGTLNVKDVADTVLGKVADILGERKPSRRDKSRLARFMLAVSDRIAIWIEGVLRAANQGLSASLTNLST